MPVQDYKDSSGKWVPYQTNSEGGRHTRSFQLYKDMLLRCEVGGKYQAKYHAYIGCTSSFESYQHFAEWCNTQIGYGEPTYELDKDILVKNNKVYGADTCVFVPRYINAMVKTNKSRRGDCPIGVTYDKERNKYAARLSTRAGCKALGRYETIESAFDAYKNAKEFYVKQVATQWRDKIDPRAYEALMNFKVEITD